MNAINRRRFERFVLQPMYTPVSVRLADSQDTALEGHAYDVSEAGVRFELDSPVAPGTAVMMQITLPTGLGEPDQDTESGRSVLVQGNVVWLDDSEPGPVRMAMVITRFVRLGDRDRLLRRLISGRYARAA
jgi:hypothetical protein